MTEAGDHSDAPVLRDPRGYEGGVSLRPVGDSDPFPGHIFLGTVTVVELLKEGEARRVQTGRGDHGDGRLIDMGQGLLRTNWATDSCGGPPLARHMIDYEMRHRGLVATKQDETHRLDCVSDNPHRHTGELSDTTCGGHGSAGISLVRPRVPIGVRAALQDGFCLYVHDRLPVRASPVRADLKNLEVGPAEFVLDLLVALLDPRPQAVTLHGRPVAGTPGIRPGHGAGGFDDVV